MDLITLAALGGAAYLALQMRNKKKGSGGGGAIPPGENVSSGFEPFGPDQQGSAWYAAISQNWTFTGELGDNLGHRAQTYRGAQINDPAQAATNRVKFDAAFRQAMSKGYRVVVSDLLSAASAFPPYLLLVPDGFNRASVPSDWGPLRQLYAPPPGSFGVPAGGGGGVNPGPFGDPPPGPGGSPFDEIPDAATRAQVQELFSSETAGLLELDEMAKLLDKAGYPASAAALRERRKQVALQRQVEAKSRGGWLYVLRANEALPFKLAQYYSGQKPGALKQLGDLNPTVSQGGSWKGWYAGNEILLPGTWKDPSLLPLPPLTQGSAPKPTTSSTTPQTPPGGGGGGGLLPSANDRIAQLQNPNDPRNAAERLAEINAGAASPQEPLAVWRARKLAEVAASLPASPPIADPWGESIDAGPVFAQSNIHFEGD